jgi:hypothetical protein
VASRRFPDNGTRFAILANGDRAKSKTITYYLDPLGQTLAAVYAERGTDTPAPGDAYSNSSTSLDAFGAQVPFRGPLDGTARIYGQVGDDGPIFPVDADPTYRFADIEAALNLLLAQAAEFDERITGLETDPPLTSGFSLDDDDPGIVYAVADSVFPGITTDGDVLVVDTILATGATTDGDVLVLTV